MTLLRHHLQTLQELIQVYNRPLFFLPPSNSIVVGIWSDFRRSTSEQRGVTFSIKAVA